MGVPKGPCAQKKRVVAVGLCRDVVGWRGGGRGRTCELPEAGGVRAGAGRAGGAGRGGGEDVVDVVVP